MINFISEFIKTPTGQTSIRVIFSALGVGGLYLIVMNIAELIIQLETSKKAKIKTKLYAKLISVILGIGMAFLISFIFYQENDRKLLIGQSLIYYFVSVGAFLFVTSDKFKDIIRKKK